MLGWFLRRMLVVSRSAQVMDSDYAGDLDKCRSTTRYVFTLSQALLSWHCTLQYIVALSMTEAEYIALTETIKEATWLQGLMDDLGIEPDFLRVHCYSMSAILNEKPSLSYEHEAY